MKTVLHRADTRGKAAHGGWLNSAHSFSFAQYYNPERMGFGALRVLNDDAVAGGGGFPTHGHQNMEIVSIPLQGNLAHKDNLGHTEVIRQGDVQIMSAGTGVMHSEFNQSQTEPVQFLQIWILPAQQQVAPRYAQRSYDPLQRHNRWQTVIAPFEDALLESSDAPLPIYQQAYFALSHLEQGADLAYTWRQKGHGLYVFVLSGAVQVAGHHLAHRDGLGVTETEQVSFTADSEAELLVIEVPL